MHNSEIRLECLKLAHRPDRSAQENIAVAREYLSWVGAIPTTAETQPGDGSKAAKLAPPNKRTSLPKTGAKASE